ncbi:LptF/LptG family permease [Terrimonas alba]|uniref:LptF/LptG family permease n=1 Tax=Terrimonas alba TaxID=3349636 RepID=UPI0035F3AE3D
MFKKLDKLIVKAFIGPFIATFFITLLVLVMQFFWLYIDDFVGKGLGIDIVLKFIWYQSAVLIPLALPLAILLSSLMTFGSLGESFELVAIKSAGISLLRFMRPLFFISLFISGIAFLFSNYVIPVAFLKSRTLLTDIVYAKPAFDLKEGVFYDRINGFAIKIGKKEANDSIIRDVIVYEQGNPVQDNFIIAKSGVMRVTEDKRYLEFNLKDGWRYEERGNNYNAKSDYIRLGFKEFKKQFDLSSFQFVQTNDSVNKNNERVYSMRQLNIAIDSLAKENKKVRKQLDESIVLSALKFSKYLDSTSTKKSKEPDSLFRAAKTFDDLIPDSANYAVHQGAINQVTSLTSSIANRKLIMTDKEKVLRKHKIEWHRKIVLSMACIILFLIGAPLGSIIRKGGLGTPLIAAISFFMVFYFSTTVGEKFAKEDTLTPFAGMWLAAFILVPIGVFLTYKAMRDSQLFNKEWYYRMAKSFRGFIGRLQLGTKRKVGSI